MMWNLKCDGSERNQLDSIVLQPTVTKFIFADFYSALLDQ